MPHNMPTPTLLPLDLELSRDVAAMIGAVAGACWQNCYRAVYSFRDLLPDASYVEGWVCDPGNPLAVFEHGWIELDDRIVEPTLVRLEWFGTMNLHYFASDRYKSHELQKPSRIKLLPLVRKYGGGGLMHLPYILAYRAALTLADYPTDTMTQVDRQIMMLREQEQAQ